jgi:hypothetical protein
MQIPQDAEFRNPLAWMPVIPASDWKGWGIRSCGKEFGGKKGGFQGGKPRGVVSLLETAVVTTKPNLKSLQI